jgi:hypothetical protein
MGEVVTGKVLPSLVVDEVVVVARVVVVAWVVVVARVVGVSVVVVVWRVVVVAAAVEGVVDDGAAVGAVVGVTLGEERGRLGFVDTLELTVRVDRCAAPFPLGPSATTKAVTSAKAARVAPMITILLCLSESVSVGDSRAIDTGGAE